MRRQVFYNLPPGGAVYRDMGIKMRLVQTAAAVLLATLGSGPVAAQPTLSKERAPAVPRALRPFVDQLYSADPKTRAEGACEIGRRHTDAAPAIPILLTMLSDDTVVVAIDCGTSDWTRRQLATNPDVQKWRQTSPAKEAAGALGDIGEAAVPGLLQALNHADWKTRKFAALGLGEAEPMNQRAQVIAALGDRLRDAHPEVRDRSAWALGEIEDAGAVPALVQALTDADVRVRATVAWALGEIEDASAVSGLMRALKDADANVREKAAWALGEIEDPAAVDGLAGAMKDASAAVRRTAAWALGEIEDASAVPALTRALADADWQVRKTAAWALGEIEDPSALGALKAAAGDANGEVRKAVAFAIRELRDKH